MVTCISPILVGFVMDMIFTDSEETTAVEPEADTATTMEGVTAQGSGLPDETVAGPSDVGVMAAGVANMELQTKKLSGAQKKKLRKAEKMKAGTWTKDKPTQKKVVKGEEKEKSGSAKRPHSDSSTPSSQKQATKRPRSHAQTGSYSEAAKGLRMAVVDRRHPDILLDQRQADLIMNKLGEVVDQTPSSSTSPPQFEGSRYTGGIIWITCANEHTKDWLKKSVESMGKLWEELDLTVVEAKDLPKRPKALVWIPGTPEEGDVRTRLERQNPGLKTKDWHKLSNKTEKDGTILAFSMDGASYRILEQARFKAYYGLRTVTFKPIQSTPEDNKGSTSEPPAQ